MAVLLCLSLHGFSQSFKQQQRKYPRVRRAYTLKEKKIKKKLEELNIASFNIEIFLRAFKREKVLEIWVRSRGTSRYRHLVDYPFCSFSGILGPKRKQGDRQIPEGFYHIDRFNPASNFHLSLGINYPNGSDRKLATGRDPGGDIFIHGDCVTIGCIPITDTKIRELYILAVEARSHGQRNIPVHIFPFRFTPVNVARFKRKYGESSGLFRFWKLLEPFYIYFETHRKVPRYGVKKSGKYYLIQ